MRRVARWGHPLLALAVVLAFMLALVWAAGSPDVPDSLDAEARRIAEQPFARDPHKPVIVVTGSSTVRMWRDSAAAFPGAQVVNTGFGGSTMDALAEHYDGLIGRYGPDRVFIGSGDNDIASGRSATQIVADTNGILNRLRTEMPGTTVAIIAAKPSISRWHLRARYEELNGRLRLLALQRSGVEYVDVWDSLLDQQGQVRPELYVADGLHLNDAGYRIYAATLRSGGSHRCPAIPGGCTGQ